MGVAPDPVPAVEVVIATVLFIIREELGWSRFCFSLIRALLRNTCGDIIISLRASVSFRGFPGFPCSLRASVSFRVLPGFSSCPSVSTAGLPFQDFNYLGTLPSGDLTCLIARFGGLESHLHHVRLRPFVGGSMRMMIKMIIISKSTLLSLLFLSLIY
jgi:hypothetical protein